MKKTKIFALLFPVVFLLSAGCSPFSKMAGHNKIGKEDALVLISNEPLNLRSLTYADFKFAGSPQEFKKIADEKPAFRDVLLYAKTYYPPYDYYLLLNAKEPNHPDYILKDTLIANNKITLAISKTASAEDVKFLTKKFAATKSQAQP